MPETTPLRPRRSMLYMPGSNARALDKAKTLDADALILDLEDAVAPDAKAEARAQVCAALAAGGFGFREVLVRVNGFDTPWGQADMTAAAVSGADAVLVPKVNSAEDVRKAALALTAAGAPASLALWIMIETPLSLLNMAEIAACASDPANRLAGFVLGTNDLAKETRARIVPGRAPMMPWLMTAIAGARAAGLAVMDGVYNDFRNEEGFARECAEAVDLGFDGKTLIHPSQIGPCNAAFSPPEEEVAWARKIIAAFAQAENAAKGVLQIEGRMVERLHAEMGQKLVAIAEAIAARA